MNERRKGGALRERESLLYRQSESRAPGRNIQGDRERETGTQEEGQERGVREREIER